MTFWTGGCYRTGLLEDDVFWIADIAHLEGGDNVQHILHALGGQEKSSRFAKVIRSADHTPCGRWKDVHRAEAQFLVRASLGDDNPGAPRYARLNCDQNIKRSVSSPRTQHRDTPCEECSAAWESDDRERAVPVNGPEALYTPQLAFLRMPHPPVYTPDRAYGCEQISKRTNGCCLNWYATRRDKTCGSKC